MPSSDDEARWQRVTSLLGQGSKHLGPETSRMLREAPWLLPVLLARYKFAAKMAVRGLPLLEWSCGEGLGARILAEPAGSYLGVDRSGPGVAAARKAFGGKVCRFLEGQVPGPELGTFGTVVHLPPSAPSGDPALLEALAARAGEHGRGIVGRPAPDPDLQARMEVLFQRALPFSFVQGQFLAGHAAGADYFLVVGCSPRPTGVRP